MSILKALSPKFSSSLKNYLYGERISSKLPPMILHSSVYHFFIFKIKITFCCASWKLNENCPEFAKIRRQMHQQDPVTLSKQFCRPFGKIPTHAGYLFRKSLKEMETLWKMLNIM
jgi:hypothetical protein